MIEIIKCPHCGNMQKTEDVYVKLDNGTSQRYDLRYGARGTGDVVEKQMCPRCHKEYEIPTPIKVMKFVYDAMVHR